VNVKVAGRKSSSSPTPIVLRVKADEAGPTDAQTAAYAYMLDNDAKIASACFRGIAKAVRNLRKAGWFDGAPPGDMPPKSLTPDALRTRLQLYDVCITNRVKAGVAYVEYSLNCSWDGEHGLLVVLHRDRLAYSGHTGDGW
jgi:hypothetical protein